MSKNFAMEIISNEIIDEIIIEASLVLHDLVNKSCKRLPSIRVNPYLKQRKSKGRFFSDFTDMKANKKTFQENLHMTRDGFERIFKLVEADLLPKKCTHPKDEITPKEKLAVALEYFASGSIQRHVASIYRISKQHLGKILDDVCDAICHTMKSTIPDLNEATYVEIANHFNYRWNFPNCIGAVDGKHVTLKAPKNSGSLFYNYKGQHSIVLMAVADASYRFTYLDIGAYGSEGDANVFAASKLGQAVFEDNLHFPESTSVGGVGLPYFFIGDDAFPLCKRIIKPYAGRKSHQLADDEIIFNYRLSRARRCVENAFGILCSKWLCLARKMFCSPDRAQKIVSACCFLHNYLLKLNKENYCPVNYADYYDESGRLVEGEWRQIIRGDTLFSNTFPPYRGRHGEQGKLIREKLKNYVNSPAGSLKWQRRVVFLDPQ